MGMESEDRCVYCGLKCDIPFNLYMYGMRRNILEDEKTSHLDCYFESVYGIQGQNSAECFRDKPPNCS